MELKYIVGATAEVSKTISESDVYLFAGITGDFNPVHINKVSAEASIFGERVVHGALVSGLISTVIGMKLPGPGTVYVQQDSKYLKPVKIGDTITAVVTLKSVINREKGILELGTEAFNQKQEKVVEGRAVVMAPSGANEDK